MCRSYQPLPDYALASYNRGVLNELYLQRPQVALASYEAFQSRQANPDPQVGHWIDDLRRRLAQGVAANAGAAP